MPIHAEVRGDERLPLLVCLHGLLGDPDSFELLAAPLRDEFCTVLVDLHPQNRETALRESEKSLATVNYDRSAEDIAAWLRASYPGRGAYLLGLSIGGKILFDFAAKFPELYLGGLVTDVSPGPLDRSDLFRFLLKAVPSIDVEQGWEAIKQEFRAKIPFRPFRVLLQTQVLIDPATGLGSWKPTVRGLQRMMEGQDIRDQWDSVPKLRRPTIVLKAESLSGIAAEDFERLRARPDLFEIVPVPSSSHFIHVTHAEEIRSRLRSLKTRLSAAQSNSAGAGDPRP